MRRVPDPEPLWQRRFRAPIVGFPHWSPEAPDRLIYASSESGVYQLHAWDRAPGEKRQVTNDPAGLISGRGARDAERVVLISGEGTADGQWVVWHRDVTGDESGVWVATPFDGGTGATAEPLIDDLPSRWDEGLAIGRRRTAAAVSGRAGFAVYVAEDGTGARRLLTSSESLQLGG